MTQPDVAWRNRIVAAVNEDPEQLLANPFNHRIHPQEQQDGLRAVLDRIGWVQDVIVNRQTGHVVDGHLRVALALKKGERSIPVKYVDLTPDEETLILATYDTIGARAGTDHEKAVEIVKDVTSRFTDLDGGLANILGDMQRASEAALGRGNGDGEGEGGSGGGGRSGPQEDDVYSLKEDVVFSSANEFGIPSLEPGMLSDKVVHQLWLGSGDPVTDSLFRFGETMPRNVGDGVLGMFVDAKSREKAWMDAVSVIDVQRKKGWAGVIPPDFGVSPTDPLAVQIWNYYRSAWVARYWATVGVKVIPLLMYGSHPSLPTMHLPPVISVAAFRMPSTFIYEMSMAWARRLVETCDERQVRTLLVYGEYEYTNGLVSEFVKILDRPEHHDGAHRTRVVQLNAPKGKG